MTTDSIQKRKRGGKKGRKTFYNLMKSFQIILGTFRAQQWEKENNNNNNNNKWKERISYPEVTIEYPDGFLCIIQLINTKYF